MPGWFREPCAGTEGRPPIKFSAAARGQTPRIRYQLALWLLSTCSTGALQAAVLPAERGDLLYHSYDGGGATITGPSILLRKNIGDNVSIGLNHYVDNVTSASIDVLVSASQYTEKRNENTISVDYLKQKTTMSLGYTESSESDYQANTLSLGISQDMFGDLTTVTMGFALGDNKVGQNGNPGFEEMSKVRSYRITLSQVLTKSLVMALSYEAIADEGYLNNPYRSVRYFDATSAIGYSFQQEVYPGTRTSNALALRGKYFLEQRAAVHAGYRIFSDSWGIDANMIELGYTLPYGDDWIFEASFRYYKQGDAEFYSDLFPFQDAQNFLARDKELSQFTSTTLGFGASWEFGRAWEAVERGSLNFNIDLIQFDYDNFTDLTASAPVGSEPLYAFDATVIRAFTSIWF